MNRSLEFEISDQQAKCLQVTGSNQAREGHDEDDEVKDKILNVQKHVVKTVWEEDWA